MKYFSFYCLFLCFFLQGQDNPIPNVNVGIEWEQSHYGISIIEVENGYVLAGIPSCYGSLGCVELMKTDFIGNVLWQNVWTSYPESMVLANTMLIEDTAGDYLVCGLEYSPDTDWDAMVMKVNESGDSLWKKTYSFEAESFKPDYARIIKSTSDGGYIISGSSETYSVVGEEILELYLFKIDSIGNLEWQRTYQPYGKQFSEAAGLYVKEDGGFFISGYVGNDTMYGNYRAVYKHPYLMETDSVGNVIWEKNYEQNRYWLECTAKTLLLPDNQGYILQSCVPADTLDPGYEPLIEHRWYYVSRIDAEGNTVWKHTFEAEKDKIIHNIRLSRDGKSIFGVGQDFNHEEEDSLFTFKYVGWIFKMSIEGDVLWDRQYASHEHYKRFFDLYDIVETDNCMLAATGWIKDTIPSENPSMTNSGTGDIWLMVVDSLGCPLVGCAPEDSVTYLQTLDSIDIDYPSCDLEEDSIMTINHINALIEKEIRIFPNPVKTHATIYLSEIGIFLDRELMIYNSEGQYLKSLNIDTGQKVIELSTYDLPNGIYLLTLLSEGKAIMQDKMVVIK